MKKTKNKKKSEIIDILYIYIYVFFLPETDRHQLPSAVNQSFQQVRIKNATLKAKTSRSCNAQF